MIRISNDHLTATINPHGAELWSLQDADGRELMTDADPAYWTGHAPLLFPIVGALNGGVYRLDGREYTMAQHGFARRREFETVARREDGTTLRLTDDPETRAVYPFAFMLEAKYALEGATLTIAVTATNHDSRDMPASFGFHPAFAWPLPYGEARAAHRIEFEKPEPAPLRRLVDGLIAPDTRPTPVQGRTLALDDALFEQDALIWERLESSSVRYGAPEGPQLEIAFPDTQLLGIWTKPGAHFVCVEPWHGLADPTGFDRDIWAKPGIERIAPGEARTFSISVTLLDRP